MDPELVVLAADPWSLFWPAMLSSPDYSASPLQQVAWKKYAILFNSRHCLAFIPMQRVLSEFYGPALKPMTHVDICSSVVLADSSISNPNGLLFMHVSSWESRLVLVELS